MLQFEQLMSYATKPCTDSFNVERFFMFTLFSFCCIINLSFLWGSAIMRLNPNPNPNPNTFATLKETAEYKNMRLTYNEQEFIKLINNIEVILTSLPSEPEYALLQEQMEETLYLCFKAMLRGNKNQLNDTLECFEEKFQPSFYYHYMNEALKCITFVILASCALAAFGPILFLLIGLAAKILLGAIFFLMTAQIESFAFAFAITMTALPLGVFYTAVLGVLGGLLTRVSLAINPEDPSEIIKKEETVLAIAQEFKKIVLDFNNQEETNTIEMDQCTFACP